MVCCDTTFLIDLIRKDANAIKALEKFKEEHQTLSVTVMTIAELYCGAYKSTKINAELAKIKQIIDLFLVFEMNIHSAEKYGKIRASLEKKGMKVNDRDILIAAISLAHGERTIITRDKEDFEKIHELEILSY
jgi:predicted nucleic acid-binding protein